MVIITWVVSFLYYFTYTGTLCVIFNKKYSKKFVCSFTEKLERFIVCSKDSLVSMVTRYLFPTVHLAGYWVRFGQIQQVKHVKEVKSNFITISRYVF